jgi:protein ImuB
MCIYFPEWAIDVTKRKLLLKDPKAQPPSAILLTHRIANQAVVARACKVSRGLGVKSGMAASLARAIAPKGAIFEPFDPIQDASALSTLASWCLRFSPIVGLDNDLRRALSSEKNDKELLNLDPKYYGITIDLTGTERLHGDPKKLSIYFHSLFKGTGRVAIAPTIAGAWALSRYYNKPLCHCRSQDDLRPLVNYLPARSLRIGPELESKLSEAGIYTVGDLERISRSALSQRFGKPLLYRLALLNGTMLEPIITVSPKERFITRRIFEPPLSSRKSIVLAIERLTLSLLDLLKQRGLSALRFTITVKDTEENKTVKDLSLASAANDKTRITSVIVPVIESIVFCGEAYEIAIEALDTVLVSPSQASFSGDKLRDHDAVNRAFNDLLNSFSLRIGRERILRAALTTSYIPERSYRYDSAITKLNSSELQTNETSHQYNLENIPVASVKERPTLILTPPEPITSIAMLPDKPPSWISWRGERLNIISGFGPERIAPEWWRSNLSEQKALDLKLAERDYFTLQDNQGRWLWVFRANLNDTSQNWFIHGVWT